MVSFPKWSRLIPWGGGKYLPENVAGDIFWQWAEIQVIVFAELKPAGSLN